MFANPLAIPYTLSFHWYSRLHRLLLLLTTLFMWHFLLEFTHFICCVLQISPSLTFSSLLPLILPTFPNTSSCTSPLLNSSPPTSHTIPPHWALIPTPSSNSPSCTFPLLTPRISLLYSPDIPSIHFACLPLPFSTIPSVYFPSPHFPLPTLLPSTPSFPSLAYHFPASTIPPLFIPPLSVPPLLTS